MSTKKILKSSKKRLLLCELGQRTFKLSIQNKNSSENEISSGLVASHTVSRVYSINLQNDVTPVKKKKKSKKAVTLSPMVPKYKYPVRTQHQVKRNNDRNQLSSSTELLSHHSEDTAKSKKFNGISVQNKSKKTIFSQEIMAFSSKEHKENNFQRKNGHMPLNGFTEAQKLSQSKKEKHFVSNLEDDQSWCKINSCTSQAYDNLDMIVSQHPSSHNNTSDKDRNCKSRDSQLNQPDNRNDCMKKGKQTDSDKLTKMNCDKSGTLNSKTFNKLYLKRNQPNTLKEGFKNTTNKFVNPRRIQNEDGNSLNKNPNFQHNKTKSGTFSVSCETHSFLGGKIHDKTQVEPTAKHHPHFSLKQNSTEVGRSSLKEYDSVSKSQDTTNSKKPIKLGSKKTKDVSISNLPASSFQEQDSTTNIFEFNSSPVKKKIQNRVRRADNNKKKMKEKKATELVLSLIEKIKREMQMLKEKREKGLRALSQI